MCLPWWVEKVCFGVCLFRLDSRTEKSTPDITDTQQTPTELVCSFSLGEDTSFSYRSLVSLTLGVGESSEVPSVLALIHTHLPRVISGPARDTGTSNTHTPCEKPLICNHTKHVGFSAQMLPDAEGNGDNARHVSHHVSAFRKGRVGIHFSP